MSPVAKSLPWILANVSHQDDDCLFWPFPSKVNYPHVWYKGKCQKAHRVMCELAHGLPSEKMEAAHACGNSRCCNPKHLRWATASENQQDRLMHGTSNRGSRSGSAKLNEQTVKKIMELLQQGHSQASIGRSFGVCDRTINEIARGRNWWWLTGVPRAKRSSRIDGGAA